MALKPSTETTLDGQLLIAMPGMADTRFARSIVYLCAHNTDEGAMGIVVNQLEPEVSLSDLFVQLGILDEDEKADLSKPVSDMHVHRGGPVETGRGFVLHTADFTLDGATLRIGQNVCLTSTLEILRAIAGGKGPQEAIFALGYAGWAPGQLESEIRANGWLLAPSDDAILFDVDVEAKYDRALAKLGVDPAMLSTEAGHA